MHYIENNPKTWKVYQKMIQTCKDFFVKNPILVVRRLSHNKDDVWFADQLLIDLKKIKCKFWVIEELRVQPFSGVEDYNPNILSLYISKLYKCDAHFLYFIGQIISYYDLSFFICNAKDIGFADVIVKDENSKILPLEKLIQASIKARSIHIIRPTMTSKTFNELTKISHFANLNLLILDYLHEDFDAEDFYKNQSTFCELHFDRSISDVYKNRIKKILDEIIATEEFDYKPPFIHFN
uniref:Uncharacterized protein n=1 Tax=Panagrolaimus davidi TaxID=227884 RepID=A0A914Q9A9_9BILA